MKKIFLFTLICITLSCNNVKEPNAQDIINKAIEVSGGDKIANSTIDFNFRNKHYKAIRNSGEFHLEREFKDSLDIVRDVYTNTKFKRFINNKEVVVADTMAVKYTSSVNSVHYFSVLPYGLNTPAVHKTYIEEVVIKESKYHKIKVTFSEDGGGEDFEDIFLYWINTETFKTEYLAYSYLTDGGGMRFREAYNERFINGIRFVDYNNYKPVSKDANLFDLDRLFENKELKLLSVIKTENIEVK